MKPAGCRNARRVGGLVKSQPGRIPECGHWFQLGWMNTKALVSRRWFSPSLCLPQPASPPWNMGQDPAEIPTKVRGGLLLPIEDLKPTLAARSK